MQDLQAGAKGEAVRQHQEHCNNRLRAHRDPPIAVDGQLGPATIAASAYAAWFLGAMDETIAKVKGGLVTAGVQELIANPAGRDTGQLTRARARRDEHFGSLRERAHKVADGLVGIVEQGGNNMGPMVDKIIRANGGTGPEPWCGDTMAYCYQLAGSHGVDRRWASVDEVGTDPDVKVIPQAEAKVGDLVRYTFEHIGMLDEDAAAHPDHIQTIEGNTGSTGAVSDSHSGQDGVKRKERPKALVKDYLTVLR